MSNSFKIVTSPRVKWVLILFLSYYSLLPPPSADHINEPPIAHLQPGEQIINLPTSKAIIDASESSDDITEVKNLKFKWELETKPLGNEI